MLYDGVTDMVSVGEMVSDTEGVGGSVDVRVAVAESEYE